MKINWYFTTIYLSLRRHQIKSYMTSPIGKSVREQHSFSLCPSHYHNISMAILRWHTMDCAIFFFFWKHERKKVARKIRLGKFTLNANIYFFVWPYLDINLTCSYHISAHKLVSLSLSVSHRSSVVAYDVWRVVTECPRCMLQIFWILQCSNTKIRKHNNL